MTYNEVGEINCARKEKLGKHRATQAALARQQVSTGVDRVLPFTSGAQAAGDTSSFTILRYAQVPGRGGSTCPAFSGGVFFEDQPDVKTGGRRSSDSGPARLI